MGWSACVGEGVDERGNGRLVVMEWSPDHGPGSPAVAAEEMVSWGSEMVGRKGAPCGGG